MILIGVSGKKGSGKDLLASFFKERYGFINIPFAKELKESVRRDFNLTKEQTDGILKEVPTNYVEGPLMSTSLVDTYWTPRKIMIEYGQFFRKFDKNWWVKKTFDKIGQIDAMYSNPADVRITISDVRFKNEADYIKDQGGILIRLERKPELNIYKDVSNDISETDLDNYQDFDFKLNKEENIEPKDLSDLADTVMEAVLANIGENA